MTSDDQVHFVAQDSDLAELEEVHALEGDPTQGLEEEVSEALADVDLRQALLACFTSRESYLWSVSELEGVLSGLGIRKGKAALERILGELAVELELASWSPWLLVEGQHDWRLEPKNALVSVLSGHRKITGELAKRMSDRHKAVLLVVLCYKGRGGVSRTRLNQVLGFESEELLRELKSWRVVYPDSVRGYIGWLPTSAALLSLGYRSISEIPGLKELEEWIVSQDRQGSGARLDRIFEKHDRWAGRRKERDKERRESVALGYSISPPPPRRTEGLVDGSAVPIDQERASEFF